eukprot:TRINITY_DN12497_c0_g1_i5.p1 TRINITY_DN12497_c0_g1~~TRINITY_DN12497_c0_g1_i5.p1  ORF type:complete len:513 (+),score=105.86 TRINITY_DN12497_c0_g1_i5:79-1539(+)
MFAPPPALFSPVPPSGCNPAAFAALGPEPPGALGELMEQLRQVRAALEEELVARRRAEAALATERALTAALREELRRRTTAQQLCLAVEPRKGDAALTDVPGQPSASTGPLPLPDAIPPLVTVAVVAGSCWVVPREGGPSPHAAYPGPQRLEVALRVTATADAALASVAAANMRRMANALCRAPRSDVMGPALEERYALLVAHFEDWQVRMDALGALEHCDEQWHRTNPQPRLVLNQINTLVDWKHDAEAVQWEEQTALEDYPDIRVVSHAPAEVDATQVPVLHQEPDLPEAVHSTLRDAAVQTEPPTAPATAAGTGPTAPPASPPLCDWAASIDLEHTSQTAAPPGAAPAPWPLPPLPSTSPPPPPWLSPLSSAELSDGALTPPGSPVRAPAKLEWGDPSPPASPRRAAPPPLCLPPRRPRPARGRPPASPLQWTGGTSASRAGRRPPRRTPGRRRAGGRAPTAGSAPSAPPPRPGTRSLRAELL